MKASLRISPLPVAFLCVFLSLSTASAQQQAQRAAISATQATIMVRTALVALNHANRTGNYTVLRELTTPGFQRANSAARLAVIFNDLRQKNLDLSPVVVLRPVFNPLPFVNRRGLLVLKGHFPSRPLGVLFTLGFANLNGRWVLHVIGVDAKPLRAAAPASKPQAGPKPKPKPKARPKARAKSGKGDLKKR